MSIVLALCAAFCNALYVMLQHLGSTSGQAARASPRELVVRLFHSPLWLLGWVAGGGGFVFQAAALNHGELSIVQAVFVTELVFGLVLRRVWIRQTIAAAAWASAGLACVGLAGFVLFDQPQGGSPVANTHAWAAAVIVCGGAAALMALAAGRGSPRRRAALYASAAGIVWALEATFIKSTTETLTAHGLIAALSAWQLYALMAGGIAGAVLVQAALHTGPLSVSDPLITIVDPSVSVVLSIWLFQESYAGTPAAIAASLVSFALMCIGVLALTRTAPATLEAPSHDGAPSEAAA